MYISICVQGLDKFLKFFWSKFQPGYCSYLVLNYWANLSLGVLIKFVLKKKKKNVPVMSLSTRWVITIGHCVLKPRKVEMRIKDETIFCLLVSCAELNVSFATNLTVSTYHHILVGQIKEYLTTHSCLLTFHELCKVYVISCKPR